MTTRTRPPKPGPGYVWNEALWDWVPPGLGENVPQAEGQVEPAPEPEIDPNWWRGMAAAEEEVKKQTPEKPQIAPFNITAPPGMQYVGTNEFGAPEFMPLTEKLTPPPGTKLVGKNEFGGEEFLPELPPQPQKPLEPPKRKQDILFDIMKDVLPDMTVSYGMSPQQAADVAVNNLTSYMQEQPDQFIAAIQEKGWNPNTEALLLGVGFKWEQLKKIFPSIFEDKDVKNARKLSLEAPEQFIDMLRTTDRAKAEDLLIRMGATREQIDAILPPIDVTPIKLPTLSWLDKLNEIKNDPAKLVPFLSSGKEIVDIVRLLKAAKDLEDGIEVSKEDLLALKAYVDKAQQDTDWTYQIANILGQLPAFAGEFVATGGIFATGQKLAVKAGTEALKNLATKTGARVLESKLAQFGIKLAGVAAGGTLRTIPAGITRIPATTLEKQLQSTLSGDEESVFTSAVKALGEQWVEIVSESTGGLFPSLSKVAKGALVKAGLIKAMQKVNTGADVSDIQKVVRALGYNGVFEEMLEERVADVGHGVLTAIGLGDQPFKLPSIQQLGIELAAFSVPGVAIKIAEGIPAAIEEARLRPERGSIGKVPERLTEQGKRLEFLGKDLERIQKGIEEGTIPKAVGNKQVESVNAEIARIGKEIAPPIAVPEAKPVEKVTPEVTKPIIPKKGTRFEELARKATDEELRQQIVKSKSTLSVKGITERTRQWEENALKVAQAELDRRVTIPKAEAGMPEAKVTPEIPVTETKPPVAQPGALKSIVKPVAEKWKNFTDADIQARLNMAEDMLKRGDSTIPKQLQSDITEMREELTRRGVSEEVPPAEPPVAEVEREESARLTREAAEVVRNLPKQKIAQAVNDEITAQVKETANLVDTPDVVQKLTQLINLAEPIRETTEGMKHEELSKRTGRAAAILRSNEGREAFQRSKSALKGELPKADFSPPELQLTDVDIKALFNKIRDSELRYFEQLNTAEALEVLLSGNIPTRGEIKLLENMFGSDLAKAILKKRSLGTKIWENTLDLLNLPRAVLASWDLSAPLRQGAVLFWGQPKQSLPAFKPMFKAFASEKNTLLIDDIIKKGKYADLRESAGLYHAPLFGVSAKLTEREESFMSRFAQYIPLIRQSERAYVTYLNKLRADVFDSYVAQWEGTNKTMKDYKELAKFINRATGRGGLGALSNSAPILSALFFSPRYQASRITLPVSFFTATPAVRRMIARNIVSFVGANLGILSLLVLAGATVEDDPRSADFGKGKVGNTRFDFWAGFQQYARAIVQIITGMRKVSTTGKLTEAERADLIAQFVRSKLSPIAGLVTDIVMQETFLGEELSVAPEDVRKQAYEKLTPMFIQDLVEAVADSGIAMGVMSLPGLLGVGVQTYGGGYWSDFINQLGQPKPKDTLPYSVNKDDIYTSKNLWSDTLPRIRGVAIENMTEQYGFPEMVKAIAKARDTKDEYENRPTTSLKEINSDISKGDTFEHYYQQWQNYQKAGDKEKWLKDNPDYDKYYMGNFSHRELALLREYNSLTDKKAQNQFLKDHPELDQNPRLEWLKSHPKENAQLAVWGQAKVLTQAAYDEAQRLIKTLDIPDSAVADSLPPKDVAKASFDYNDAIEKFGGTSVQARFIRTDDKLNEWLKLERIDEDVKGLELKVKNYETTKKYEAFSDKESSDYIADEKTRKAAQETFKANNLAWVEDLDRIDARSKGTRDKPTPDDVVDKWVDKGRVARESKGYDAEEKVWYLDNPAIHKWALENKLTTDDGSKWNAPVLRLQVKPENRKIDEQREILKGDDEALKKLMATPAGKAWKDDQRRITAYQNDGTEIVESWVEHGKVSDEFGGSSAESKVWLYDHRKEWTWALGKKLLSDEGQDWNIPVLRLNVKWRKQDTEYDAILSKYNSFQQAEQDKSINDYLKKNIEYKTARIRRSGYELGLSEQPLTGSKTGDKPPIEKWVEYGQLPESGYWRDRYRLDNPDFDKTVKAAQLSNKKDVWEDVNPAKVPNVRYDIITEQYRDLFKQYEEADVKGKRSILAGNKDFANARMERDAYKLLIGSERYVPNYMEYYKIVNADTFGDNYEDDWYLMEHPDFYNTMRSKLGWRPRDFNKVPSREVWSAYQVYSRLTTTLDRYRMRASNSGLDNWLYLTGRVSEKIDTLKDYEQLRARGGPSEVEAYKRYLGEEKLSSSQKKFKESSAEIDALLESLRQKLVGVR